MAQSPAHKLGQIIGDTVEGAVEPLLREFAAHHGLFLDVQGPRPARTGKSLRWQDHNGNTHDLDFVLERNGSPNKIGEPAAFIESAYRRYTKHSRNKAQEIQGAILPLKRTYWRAHPFTGIVLAGVFTEGAINQLESVGFSVLYFPWDTVVAAFRSAGVNVHFDEDTAQSALAAKVEAWENLEDDGYRQIANALIDVNRSDVGEFMEELEITVTRAIESVLVVPLHGEAVEWDSVANAIEFVSDYGGGSERPPLHQFEIQVRYTNGDRIDAQFQDRTDAIEFLEQYR